MDIPKAFGLPPPASNAELFNFLPVLRLVKLQDEIQNLMALKKTGAETDGISLIPAINEFIESELARLENKQPAYKNNVASFEILDAIFRGALSEVWNDSPA